MCFIDCSIVELEKRSGLAIIVFDRGVIEVRSKTLLGLERSLTTRHAPGRSVGLGNTFLGAGEFYKPRI
jgi:hypothetical protein